MAVFMMIEAYWFSNCKDLFCVIKYYYNDNNERIKTMKIFYGDKDTNYNNPDKYAFLNWRFDDSMGTNNKDNPFQSVNDNFEMGKAYMANAVLSVYSIVKTQNYCNVADQLIFPIMFDIWHGVELWLKSSITAIHLFSSKNKKLKYNHDIYNYMDTLKNELYNLDMNKTIKIALTEVNTMVEEFKRVNARFDFARYSFDNRNQYQFYNAPYGDKEQWQNNQQIEDKSIVPNTCVDLEALYKLTVGIATNFRNFVEFLTLVRTEGGELTDKCYKEYLKSVDENRLLSDDDERLEPIHQIMDIIYSYIL